MRCDFPARKARPPLRGNCIHNTERGFLAHRLSQIGNPSSHSLVPDWGTHAPGHTVGQRSTILAESLASEFRRTLRRVDLIEHQIDDYSRHTNIEPQWKSPSRNDAVLVKPFHPRAP